MAENRRHITLQGFSSNENFAPKGSGRSPDVPVRNREQHGQRLTDQFDSVLQSYLEKREQIEHTITDDMGIYVEITGIPDIPLPLDSLDTRDFKLYSCTTTEDDREVALVFIPEVRRFAFQKKINEYLNPEKGSAKELPRNHRLLDSIDSIRLASLRSFWTDNPDSFPDNDQQTIWWELWLKKRDNEDPKEIAQALAECIAARLGKKSREIKWSANLNLSYRLNALGMIDNLKTEHR